MATMLEEKLSITVTTILSLRNLKTKYDMKHELDRMMSIIKDYGTGYGDVADSFMRKELEMFAKDYHKEQCSISNVAGRSEQLKAFAEYCDEEHGLFIPSWMIDGYNKSR